LSSIQLGRIADSPYVIIEQIEPTMPWNPDSDLAFFHGTDSNALAAYIIPQNGLSLRDSANNLFKPILAKCRSQTDFGRGFYVTSNLRQAKEWANEVVLKSVAKGSVTSQAVVLRFVMRREAIVVADAHSFVSETVDYYNFTDEWRGALPGTTPHQRTMGKVAYDFVHGPVRLNRQHIILQNCDQLSLHTDTALNAITDVLLEDMAAPGTVVSPSAFSYP